MDILIATTNKGKIADYRGYLSGIEGVTLYTLNDLPFKVADIDEPYDTLEANARHKAEGIADQIEEYICTHEGFDALANLVILVDDSGLFVDKLDGLLGVYSHRFASENPTEEENNALLLSLLGDSPVEERTATYRSCVVLFNRGVGLFRVYESESPVGYINYSVRGDGGFAYDKLFTPVGMDKTLGELTEGERRLYIPRFSSIEYLVHDLLTGGFD